MKEKLCTTSPKCKGRTVSVTIDMPVDLLEQVREAAALDGLGYQSLIVCYVQQGLEESKGNVKRMQFTEQAKTILEKHGVHDNAIAEIFAKFQY